MDFPYWISSTVIVTVLLIFFVVPDSILLSQSLAGQRSLIVNHSQNLTGQTTISDGTLHIVAAMVEFQPDSNDFTSGNGTFEEESIPYLENSDITIDPLPHNRSYFEAHLEFASNYFSKMSSGALTIEYHVLEDLYQLPEEMQEYSPIGEDPSSDPLADLAGDAWNEVAQSGNLNLDLNGEDRIAFVLFHAGVGRDIELTGTILEKTPQDIPSVYISRDAFRRLFDDPSFAGFPVDNGNLIVDNTLILPRTLSRAGEDVTGDEVLLQLSLNGMVTAQIGSHLGLPDLFNTETGESGIGRFGLMDGAGIFAYNGLFPPELSAWEKIYMGWSTPFTLNYNEDQQISLPASSLREENSIAKVDISSTEYFLVENRHREANQTGTTLTIRRQDGTTVEQQTFTNSDTSFVFQESGFADDLEPGVVTDVSNYDFALPGGPAEVLDQTEEDDNRILNGGILIWHIDEGIIQNQLSALEGINDNPTRRGINLMEADGAQDIGRPTAIGFFENEVNGSAFDFWWSGNDASVITQTETITLYENRFGPDTTPNNNSNSGARSTFELNYFSANLPTATFQIQPVDGAGDLYEVVDSQQNLPFSYSTPADDNYWSNYPLSTITTQSDIGSYVYIPGRDGISVYDIDNRSLLEPYSPTFGNIQHPVVFPQGENLVLAEKPSSSGSTITADLFENNGEELLSAGEFSISANSGMIRSPEPLTVSLDGTSDRIILNNEPVQDDFYPEPGIRSEQVSGHNFFLSNNGELTFTTPSETFSANVSITDEPYTRVLPGLVEQPDGGFHPFLVLDESLALFETSSDGELSRNVIHESQHFDIPALADLDGSGEIDFVLTDRGKNHVVAKNSKGAVLPNFPIQAPSNTQFTGSPIIADLNGNGDSEIIITGTTPESLNIYAFNLRGDLLDGFPLLVGGIYNTQDDIVQPSMTDKYLSAVSPAGDLRVWFFPNAGQILWGSRYGNDGSNQLSGRLQTPDGERPDFGVLNTEETYNWPNPAEDETYLRFQTSEAGEVQVRITTTSGRVIYNATYESRGGSPEEILIDTSGWGSGGYLAMVEATVDGRKERKLVKIAVAR